MTRIEIDGPVMITPVDEPSYLSEDNLRAQVGWFVFLLGCVFLALVFGK
jgi:hypothetical protein